MGVREGVKKLTGGINKTAVLVALILGLSIVGYGYLNINYKNRIFEAEQAEELKEVGRVEGNLAICLQSAETAYKEGWKSACIGQGLKETCSLDAQVATRLDERWDKLRDDCFKRWPKR